MALAVIGLALLVANPASAHSRCKDRPVKGSLSAVLKVDVATGNLTAEAKGVMSHVGRFTGYQEGRIEPQPDGSLRVLTTFRIVAANGDEIVGTATSTPDGAPNVPHTTTQILTITGGTGRFAKASGQLTAVYHVTPSSFDGVTLTNLAEGPFKGHIRY